MQSAGTQDARGVEVPRPDEVAGDIDAGTFTGGVGNEASGFLRYRDLAEPRWHFMFRENLSGHLSVEVIHVGRTAELGEPQYNNEQGWVNRPPGH